jgi:hypothetical protein
MKKWLLVVLSLMLTASISLGQDATSTPASETDPEIAEPVDAADDEPDELDEQVYGKQDEDVFIPSEEIPLDQDIPFPTDI